MNVKDKLIELSDKQQTISDLIDLGEILIKENGSRKLHIQNTIEIQTVFKAKIVSITSAYFKENGAQYPVHYHKGIIEYLLCLKGSFGITLPHNGYRILKERECAKIPADIMHAAISLEDNSELLGICLPAEPAYVGSPEIPNKGENTCLQK
jgi:quercetin dioxygenase-like cupin family protein